MRILLVNDGGAPVGGAELQALRMRELLRDRGHEVRLLAADTGELGLPSQADVTVHGTTHHKLRVLNQTVNPDAARVLRRELARFRPDVVHVRMFLTQLSPTILPVLRDVPTIWQVVLHTAVCPRGTKMLPDGTACQVRAGRVCLDNDCVSRPTWLAAMIQQRLWRRWSGAIDQVVTLSESMRTTLAANGIDDVEVIANGVPHRPPRPPLRDPPTIAFAGRLVPEKGADVLLEAVAALATTQPDLRTVVAGDGPQAAELRERARTLGVGDRVRFLGHVDRDTVERELARAWVQVVPGRWPEPLGNVTLEAMARGTAVIATAIGGPGEVVEDGRTGLLVEPGSVGSLTATLAELVTDRDRCERLGAAGRVLAQQRYTEAATVDRFEALYARLTATSTR